MGCRASYVPLGEIAKFESGGTPSKKNKKYWNGSIPWISAKTLVGDTVYESDLAITKEGLEAGSKLAPKGSLLLLTRGSGLFKRIPLAIAGKEVAFNQDIKCVNSAAKGISNRYLFYALTSLEPSISAMLETTGIGAGKLATDRLKALPVPVLDEAARDKVTHFADCIYRKIHLNTKLNGYLEELFDLIFQRLIDGADSDWDTASLLDIADYKNGLAMQKFRPDAGDEGLPVLKIRELGQGFCGSDAERCKNSIVDSAKIHDGDLIFSWSGTLLLDFWAGGNAGLNQHLFKVTSSAYPSWFYYGWTKHHLARFIMLAKDRATTMGHIKRSALAESEVVIPPDNILLSQTQLMQPIIDQYVISKIEARRLAVFRDSLLPKLMSGEIDVSQVDLTQLNSHLA